MLWYRTSEIDPVSWLEFTEDVPMKALKIFALGMLATLGMILYFVGTFLQSLGF